MPQFDEEKQNKKIEELRQKEEEDLARILSGKYGLEYIDLSRTAVNTNALQLIEEEEARTALIAAFARKGNTVSLALKSPHKDETKVAIQKLEDRGYTIVPYMVSTQSLEQAWKRYREISYAVESKAGMLDISGDAIQKTLTELKTLRDAQKKIEEVLGQKKAYRISSILEITLAGALATKASDIHVEPEEDYVRLRFRLDGVLTDILTFDRETYGLLLSRIKLISGLKLNIKNRAQDGRFSVRIDQEDIEVRTSILPGSYGESIVLRLLNPSTIALPMEELGISGQLFSILEREIKKPNGMILNTGPTGSGKTTTLYAFLKRVHSPDIKIITIEDPVEYHLPGVVQTQTSEDYTFGSGLRSALRQDPDIIMVGEIRDSEVAETAVNASLTGHLVFSTLHTNTAAGAFPRLIDLGVNSSVLSSAINIVMAQRLVRNLKPDCRREVKLEGAQRELVDRVLESMPDKQLIPKNTDTVWEPVEENDACGIPYAGRSGIFEAILMDEEIGKQVEMSASAQEIRKAARAQHILTMEQDGILKVLSGTTSLSELSRVLDLERALEDQIEEDPS
jgi:type IV pilus assembly protein PilB